MRHLWVGIGADGARIGRQPCDAGNHDTQGSQSSSNELQVLPLCHLDDESLAGDSVELQCLERIYYFEKAAKMTRPSTGLLEEP